MFISKKSIARIVVLLACMMVSALSVKAVDDECKLFQNVSNAPGDYYENQYYKFQLLKGMTVYEQTRGHKYEIGKYLKISRPQLWKDFVKNRVPSLFPVIANEFTKHRPEKLTLASISTEHIFGPYGQPDKKTIKIGNLPDGEQYVGFSTVHACGITTQPCWYSRVVLIKTSDNKFLDIEAPDFPDCSQERNSAQLKLILSTLDIKHSKMEKRTIK